MTVLYDEKWKSGPRKCGGCTLCCKLLPVHEGHTVNGRDAPGSFHKPAGQRCPHQRTGKGCAIYRKPGFPTACMFWNCRWLVNDDTADLHRPDRSHYVLDILPDFVTVTAGIEEGAPDAVKVEVIQVWVDPGYPDAYKDPALLAYLERRGEQGIAAIIRYSSSEAFVMFPPAMTSSGQFVEKRGGTVRPQRSFDEQLAGVAEARGVKGMS